MKKILIKILLLAAVALPSTLAAWETRASPVDPCAEGNSNDCVENSRCESNFYPPAQQFIYYCPCDSNFSVGNGFYKCQSLCQKQASDAAALRPTYTYIRPVCDVNTGLFLRAQCRPNESNQWSCKCVDQNSGVPIEASEKPYENFHFDDCIESTMASERCRVANDLVIRQGNVRFNSPSCDADGNYLKRQCAIRTQGQCWCVDTMNGKEIEGTRGSAFDDSVNCDAPILTTCQKQNKAAAALRPTYTYIRPVCDVNTGLFLRAQCEPNESYQWSCKCVDQNSGDPVKGSEQPYENFHFDDCIESTLTSGRCTIASELVIRQSNVIFSSPTCDKDGNYAKEQCNIRTQGQCWCVDTMNGKEIEGTKGSAFDGSVNCDAPILTTCQKQNKAAAALRPTYTYIRPVCDINTGLFLRAQCEPNERGQWSCKCVDQKDGSRVEGSEQPYGNFHFDDCIESTLTSGRCTIASELVIRQSNVIFSSPTCDKDGNYAKKQCNIRTQGQCWCVDTMNGKEIEGTRGSAFDGSVNCDAPSPIKPDRSCAVPVVRDGYYTGTISNGRVAEKQLIQIKCNNGFRIRGPRSRKCLNGKLTKGPNRCVKKN